MAEEKKTAKVKRSAVKAQKHLDTIEEKLAGQSKNMPQMTPGSRKTMLKVLPWFSALFGIMSLVWAYDLWSAIRAISGVRNSLGDYLGFEPYIGSTTELWVLTVGYLLISVLIVLAFTHGIVKTIKKGWNFLFYAYSVAIINGLLYFLLLSQYSSSRALLTLIIGLGGLYVLFQLREHHS